MRKVIITLLLMALVLPAAICEAAYTQISQEEAARIMAEETGYIIVDVRTHEEYDEAHIPGAVLLPLGSITQESAAAVIPDTAATVMIYCRSGNRSKQAAEKLCDLGYTAVLEFGGINTWPYEIQ